MHPPLLASSIFLSSALHPLSPATLLLSRASPLHVPCPLILVLRIGRGNFRRPLIPETSGCWECNFKRKYELFHTKVPKESYQPCQAKPKKYEDHEERVGDAIAFILGHPQAECVDVSADSSIFLLRFYLALNIVYFNFQVIISIFG